MKTLRIGLLMTALTALFVFFGSLLGGSGGAVIALVLAVAMNFGSYWFSDKLVVRMTGAQPVSPEQAPELYDMLQRLSARAQIPTPRLHIVKDPSPNAFATGRSPRHAIVAVHEGLLRLLSPSEVEGVIAHELAHIRSRDTLTMAIVATVAGAIMTLAHIAQFAAFFGSHNEEGGNPIAALAMALIAPIAAVAIQMGISRSREYEADALGARIAGSPRGLANALLKLEQASTLVPSQVAPAAAHLCIVNPFAGLGGSIATLFSTHPPIRERVNRLLAQN